MVDSSRCEPPPSVSRTRRWSAAPLPRSREPPPVRDRGGVHVAREPGARRRLFTPGPGSVDGIPAIRSTSSVRPRVGDNAHPVQDQMLTLKRSGFRRNWPVFAGAQSADHRRSSNSRTGLFTTGPGMKARGCKLLIWRALQDSNLPASALRATAWSRRSSAEPPSERRRTTSWFVARTRPLCVPLPPPARKRRNSLQPLID
jgi:hypothetical protein